MPLGPPSHHGDDVPLGLAGAEKHLYQVNLDAGQLQVQRAILQLRVDYLSQLNTQTMLLAGAAVGTCKAGSAVCAARARLVNAK
eukprot:6199546-Pleurochrysis_carterae.AAC.2